jgi:4-amino-4-deoxy-L-arabinose transferase-like glycosyltransferase
MMTSRPSYFSRYDSSVRLVAICILVIAVLTILRGIFAATIELRVDEAYYWTWSKENVISYLDHPPMIAWFIRFGRFAFGDTGFGVRFSGLLAMLVTQLLLADIVWQSLRDPRYVAIAVLLPEVAIEHWFALTKVTPDTALIPFALAMVWSLVRFSLSENPRSTSVLFPLGFFVWRAPSIRASAIAGHCSFGRSASPASRSI